jgi:hypothetical protein
MRSYNDFERCGHGLASRKRVNWRQGAGLPFDLVCLQNRAWFNANKADASRQTPYRDRDLWIAPRDQPYDFLVQSESWKLGPVSIEILRKQFDKTYVVVTFDNNDRAITLNFVVVKGADGWVISDVESPHDSLRLFLAQFKR